MVRSRVARERHDVRGSSDYILTVAALRPEERSIRSTIALVIALALAASCSDRSSRSRAAAPEEGAAEPTAAAMRAPSPGTEIALPKTTAPTLAVANLERRISSLQRAFDRDSARVALAQELVPLVLVRARTLGVYDDFERATKLAQRYVDARPRLPAAYLTRARAHAAVHRFQAALSDLDKTRELSGQTNIDHEVRATVLQALGAYDDALALRTQLADIRPNLQSLGALAALQAEMGLREAAEANFQRALSRPGAGDPFAVSWIGFQYGRMFEEAGQLTRARALYRQAHARMPRYVALVSHLAATVRSTGDAESAAALLRDALAHGDEPELLGSLAEIARARGDHATATDLLARARAGFVDLLDRFPDAFADHGARHFLRVDPDPERAAQLARHNLTVRQTPSAHVLAMETALAASQPEYACQVAESGIRLPYATDRLRFQAWRAFTSCGQEERASALAKRLGMVDSAVP